MFFLQGVARYLFLPLAEAVIFAMLASYVLSRTLVPTMAIYLLKAKAHRSGGSHHLFSRFPPSFEAPFARVRGGHRNLRSGVVSPRFLFHPTLLFPWPSP